MAKIFLAGETVSAAAQTGYKDNIAICKAFANSIGIAAADIVTNFYFLSSAAHEGRKLLNFSTEAGDLILDVCISIAAPTGVIHHVDNGGIGGGIFGHEQCQLLLCAVGVCAVNCLILGDLDILAIKLGSQFGFACSRKAESIISSKCCGEHRYHHADGEQDSQ